MEKALQNVSKLRGKCTAQALRLRFKRVRAMPGAGRLFKRIASTPDADQLGDYLAEIQYALVFAGLRFQVEVEPQRKDGPDLGISRDNRYAVVEVMRFRKVYQGPLTLDVTRELGVFPEYGNPSRDIQKSFHKILTKFRQVQNDESIIAIWNDDADLEESEVKGATARVRDATAQGSLNSPSGLLFILYGSNWIKTENRRQLYCFPVRCLAQGHQRTWQQELESFTVEQLVQEALRNR